MTIPGGLLQEDHSMGTIAGRLLLEDYSKMAFISACLYGRSSGRLQTKSSSSSCSPDFLSGVSSVGLAPGPWALRAT